MALEPADWGDTLAARLHSRLGTQYVPTEQEQRFAAELPERERMAAEYRVAHGLEDTAGRVTAKGRELAALRDERAMRGRDWLGPAIVRGVELSAEDIDAAKWRKLLADLQAQQHADAAAASAVVYGPADPPFDSGRHIGRTVQ
jgi:hypothetical protein